MHMHNISFAVPFQMSSTKYESIPDRILRHASNRPAHDAAIFLDRGEQVSCRLTYESLVLHAGRLAGRLVAEGLSHKAVMISLPAGTDFVTLFLACLWARAIAIPAPHAGNGRLLERLRALVADSHPAAVITDEAGAARLGSLDFGGVPPRMILFSDLSGDGSAAIGPIEGDADAPAIIQYTSGSTSEPRGVVITFANLYANQLMIQHAFGEDESIIGANWLPHFHDMGLLGSVLHPFFVGGTSVLMDPFAFIQKPIRWLRAIDRFKATAAGGPCFAYDLAVRQCAEKDVEALDLSSWAVAFCGAEPIRRATLEAFAKKFAPAGFRASAFLPCYGLAEATLMVSSAKRGDGEKALRPSAEAPAPDAVSCGFPCPRSHVLIRTADGADAQERTPGEIFVSGPHVSPGRWNGPDARVIPFASDYLDERGRRYISTGDIGVIAEGELTPIDRLKDIVIIYGQKLHAADIERTALMQDDVRAACAFSVDREAGAQLVLLCEVDRRRFREDGGAGLAPTIAKSVGEAHGALPQAHIFPYGSLPRTTSGKIRRSECKQAWLSGGGDLKETTGGP